MMLLLLLLEKRVCRGCFLLQHSAIVTLLAQMCCGVRSMLLIVGIANLSPHREKIRNTVNKYNSNQKIFITTCSTVRTYFFDSTPTADESTPIRESGGQASFLSCYSVIFATTVIAAK